MSILAYAPERYQPLPQSRPDLIFHLRPATWLDRDNIGLRGYANGVRQVTQQQYRAAMIEALFRQHEDGLEGDALSAATGKAEGLALELEDYWRRSEEDDVAMAAWNIQEGQRLLDIREGAPEADNPPDPKPKPQTSVRERARMNLLQTEIQQNSPELRLMVIDMQQNEQRHGDLTARFHIVGWEGLELTPTFEKEALGENILSRQCVEDLRTELYPINPDIWQMLLDKCGSLYDLPLGDVGNSGSPSENTSTSTDDGSHGKDSGSASKPGNSTSSETAASSSDTGPIPAAE